MTNESTGRRSLRAASLALAFSLLAASAMAGEAINRDADEILRSMSTFLGGAKAFSVSADIGNEVVTKDGQKLQMMSTANALLARPSRLHLARRGKFADAEAFYDGKTLTLYGKTANAYLQKDVAGGIDDALNVLEKDIGISMPAGDLLLANPYAALASGVTSSGYYGVEYVAGVRCHHLAFRSASVDWQLWVKAEGDPLPMKYVITSKDVAGAPQYSVRFSNWNLKPVISAKRFTFVAPKGAQKQAALLIDETGEVVVKQEGK
jgi:hypothetical protein